VIFIKGVWSEVKIKRRAAREQSIQSLPQRRKRVVGALAFGFEDNVQESSEVAGRPAFLFEPAEVFGGEIVKGTPLVTSEGHRPGAKFFPVGGGLGWIHGKKV